MMIQFYINSSDASFCPELLLSCFIFAVNVVNFSGQVDNPQDIVDNDEVRVKTL